MSKITKYVCALFPALFAVGAFCFFAFAYPAHLHMKEQLLLFQFTWDYFAGIAAYPGGFADWCGRFLTQFCYWSALGAFIIAALLLAVRQLTLSLSDSRSEVNQALSFIPAVALWMSLCHEYGVFGLPVALIIILLSVRLVRRMPDGVLRKVVTLVAVPVLYMLCGPLAIVYALLVLKDEKNVFIGIAAIGLAVICPFAARAIFPVRPDYLLRGWRYFFDPEQFPVMAWVSAGVLVAIVWLQKLQPREKGLALCLFLAILAVSPFAIVKSSKFDIEEEMQYGYMVRKQNWDGIIAKAGRKSTNNFLSMCAVNHALSRKGELADRMFNFLQVGPEGLLPSFTRYHDQPIYAAEAYWDLGMINTCQRYYFESQEAIPDQQKSARYYQRLAETNAVNEDFAVSQKYKDALLTTLFYRKWAKNFDPQAPEYVEKRDIRFHHIDAPFSQDQVAQILGQLYLENRSNKAAYHYAMAEFLLSKNLQPFLQALGMEKYEAVPQAYQEAFLLLFVERNHTLEGIPAAINPKTASRFEKFVNALNSEKSAEYMQKHFGDTYWFYYYYVNYSEK